MRSSLLAVRSGAGALPGLTTVFWLMAQPPAKAAKAASAIVYARPEAFRLVRLLKSWRGNLPGSLVGVNQTGSLRGVNSDGERSRAFLRFLAI
jgi:hypothetical protein